MAQQGASGSRQAVDPQEVLLFDLASDARSVVAEAKSSFRRNNGEIGRSRRRRYLQGASIVRDRAKVGEARLNGARARLAQASANVSAISVARFGAVRQTAGGSSSKSKLTEEGEGKSKFLKRKLPAPKDGWKDAKGVTLLVYLIDLYSFSTCPTSFGSCEIS